MRRCVRAAILLSLLSCAPAQAQDNRAAGVDCWTIQTARLVTATPGVHDWKPSRYELAVSKALIDQLKKSGRVTSLYRSGGCFARLDLALFGRESAPFQVNVLVLHAVSRAAYICAYDKDAGRRGTQVWVYCRNLFGETERVQFCDHKNMGTRYSFRCSQP